MFIDIKIEEDINVNDYAWVTVHTEPARYALWDKYHLGWFEINEEKMVSRDIVDKIKDIREFSKIFGVKNISNKIDDTKDLGSGE